MFTFISVRFLFLWKVFTYLRWAYTHSVYSRWAWPLHWIVWWFFAKCLTHRMRVDEYTGNWFRSSVLGVMSPARCRCAMPVKWLGCCVYSVQLDDTSNRLWSYVSAGVTTASFHYSAPVKPINCKIPPTIFDLVTTSGLPASMMLFQLSYRGCVVFGLVASVKRPKWNNTGNPFRSSDLGVMSPARCLCAMPVSIQDEEH